MQLAQSNAIFGEPTHCFVVSSWLCYPFSSSIFVGDHPEDVKARLKYWAQTVACTVKLCNWWSNLKIISCWSNNQWCDALAEQILDSVLPEMMLSNTVSWHSQAQIWCNWRSRGTVIQEEEEDKWSWNLRIMIVSSSMYNLHHVDDTVSCMMLMVD